MRDIQRHLQVIIGACLIVILLTGMIGTTSAPLASGGNGNEPIPGDTTGNDDSIEDPTGDQDDDMVRLIIFFGTIL